MVHRQGIEPRSPVYKADAIFLDILNIPRCQFRILHVYSSITRLRHLRRQITKIIKSVIILYSFKKPVN